MAGCLRAARRRVAIEALTPSSLSSRETSGSPASIFWRGGRELEPRALGLPVYLALYR
jgi:hypothetical protein